MSDVAIRAENLSKRYRIGRRERYRALRDVLTDALTAPFHWFRGNSKQGNGNGSSDYIWALKNVSFEIKPGEVVGIIGRNGAGKSTLLKILSRITEPTEGCAEVWGRVGSLLEVGTGFHPELTGRENVYLNGAILGMKKMEIDRKFDEIVDFAEVETFLDTPVKHYSVGMQVRLAFAVAAHLDPEILLVDEVLAVGDARFQKRCLGRLGEVAKSGRTVVFVSHNMQAVSIFCPRAILLEKGRVADEGPARRIVSKYLASVASQLAQAVWPFEESPGNEIVRLRAVRAVNRNQEPSMNILIGEPISLEVEFWCLRKAPVLASFHLLNEQGMLLFSTGNLQEWSQREFEPGLHRCSCLIPPHLLTEGGYYVTLYLSRGPYARIDAHQPEVISFQVVDDGSGRGDYTGQWTGLIRPLLRWTGERVGDLPCGQLNELRRASVAQS